MGFLDKMYERQAKAKENNRIFKEQREEKKAKASQMKAEKELLKAEKKATIEKFKKVTVNKLAFQMLIKQDSSQYFTSKEQLSHIYVVYQHEAGKVVIDNLKEYYFMSYTWTPNIVGNKHFSAVKALTGAALIGELGLLAGARGKKGEDKSYATLLLKDIATGEYVKMVGDVKIPQAEKLAGFITTEEIGLNV